MARLERTWLTFTLELTDEQLNFLHRVFDFMKITVRSRPTTKEEKRYWRDMEKRHR